jgi:1-acyl-sn-glycerol-3-phosphate acyltransferase
MGWLILLIVVATLVVVGLMSARADWGGAHVNWLDGWTRIICRYLHGLKNTKLVLPETGPAIVVANHVSGVDPLLLIAATHRPLRFLIATEQYERLGLHWLFRLAGCIPVDRTGRPEQALRAARRALEQGEVLAIFPHGRIHLDTDPPRPIKGGVVRLAAWTDAPIYPVRIDGVKAQGKIIAAPFTPDKVNLLMHPPLSVGEEDVKALIAHIAHAIETPVTSSH